MSTPILRRYVSNGLSIVVDTHATSWRFLSPTPNNTFFSEGVLFLPNNPTAVV